MVPPDFRHVFLLYLMRWISADSFALQGNRFPLRCRAYATCLPWAPSSLATSPWVHTLAPAQALHGKPIRDDFDGIVPSTPDLSRKSGSFGSLLAKSLVFMVLQPMLFRMPAWAAQSTGKAAATTSPLPLSWRNLASATGILLVSCAAMVGRWNQATVAKQMAVACVRCFLQLQALGGLVLTKYLAVSQCHLSLVLLWIGVTGILAAVEASSRVQNRYPRMVWHASVALLASGSTVLGAAALARVFGDLKPWFSPLTWIPISGMLYGNAVTACGLAMSTWTRELVDRRGPIEWRLSRGASWREAIKLPLRLTFASALTPVINALSVTGLVHLPGMMTGQILAGQPPYQAAAYQVLIFFLIAASAVVSVQTFMSLAVKQFVDATDDRLLAVESILGTCQSTGERNSTSVMPASGSSSPITYPSRQRAAGRSCGSLGRVPVLQLEEMLVERTGARVSIELFSGDRIGIKGPSGIGKSQVFRTLSGLDRLERSSVFLCGECASGIPMPEWRKNVAFVLQDRPSLEGTPRIYVDELRRYKSLKNISLGDPCDFIRDWGFSSSLLDQPWSALSGGEAQAAAIAIALSLKPKVLLLDESMNALDDASSIKVESTVESLEVPVLLVSHSTAQLDRFCTTVLDYMDWSR